MARGRNRKIGPRERNGRSQRRPKLETEAAIMEVALAPRLRAGISPQLARAVGTPEALLWAENEQSNGRSGISRDQYEAACYFQEVRMRYMASLDERTTPQEPRLARGTGDEGAHERFCDTWIDRWDAIKSMVDQFQGQIGNTGNLWGALNGLERGSILEHQISDLRIALNAVDRVRKGMKKNAA